MSTRSNENPIDTASICMINPTDNIPNNQTIYTIKPPVPPQETQPSPSIRRPGDLSYISDVASRDMLENAYKAITQTEMWPYMRRNTESFMMSGDKERFIISEKMQELGYYGHSGVSFGWTMRSMQHIAIHGDESFKRMWLSRPTK